MTTTLVAVFPLGRVHATPWGRHVNEGQVEFPPAPWRILRALYATWRQRVPDLDEATVRALLGHLASPPQFFVPPHQIAHTRHYYPDSRSRRGAASVDRTLDAFAVLDPHAELGIQWSAHLPTEEHKALTRLAEALPYLGRADSISELRVDDGWEPTTQHATWTPAAQPDTAIGASDEPAAGDTHAQLLGPRLPLDLDSLVLTPLQVRATKMLFPPSTYPVPYRISEGTRPTPPSRRRRADVTVVRMALPGRVRPPFTETVTLTDLLHQAATRQLMDLRGQIKRDSNLLGKTADGRPMRDHQHAHYLCLPDSQRRIKEIIIWAPGGLADDELQALSQTTVLSTSDPTVKLPRLSLRINAIGQTNLLPEWDRPSSVWHSITPYTPTGNPKGDWGHSIRRRLETDLQYADPQEHVAGQLQDVEVIDNPDGYFQRRRSKDRLARRAAPPAAFLQLRFAQPVAGPVSGGPMAVGTLSHFGLGLFLPVHDDT